MSYISTTIQQNMDDLLLRRTRVWLWLGIVFFPAFSFLDYFCVQPFFQPFLALRLLVSLFLGGVLVCMRLPVFQVHVRSVILLVACLTVLSISAMTVQLGGFSSGYYVGILLIVAGTLSMLPLGVGQTAGLGLLMFLIYFCCNIFFDSNRDSLSIIFNNEFFFFVLVAVLSMQRYDEKKILKRYIYSSEQFAQFESEINRNTTNFEDTIQNKVENFDDYDMQFFEIYNNIPDSVVLLDLTGNIRLINSHGAALFERTCWQLQGRSFLQFIPDQDDAVFRTEIFAPLLRGEPVNAAQTRLLTHSGRVRDVEISASVTTLPGPDTELQLFIRDISGMNGMGHQGLESGMSETSRAIAIFDLASMMERGVEDAGAHLARIREYSRILAMELARSPKLQTMITSDFVEELCAASILHDIGKIAIPDSILLKPGRLTLEESQIMQQHCRYGRNALDAVENATNGLSCLRMSQEITLHHHEKWNGSGYPCGLAGENIPLSARIVALADVYDALTSRRPYHAAVSHGQACAVIAEESGQHFDPAIASAFLKCEDSFRAARSLPGIPLVSERKA